MSVRPRPQETLTYRLPPDEMAETLGVSFTDPGRAATGQPPVILVHGLNGNMTVWQNRPQGELPAVQSRATHPTPPPLIPRLATTVSPFAPEGPNGLWEALETAGFAGLSWQQNDGRGPLPGKTDHELAAVVDFARQTYNADKVFLVGHSRGGLVTRAYLAQPGAAAKVAVQIAIGTPHYGMRLASVPEQLEGAISSALLNTLGLPGKIAAWAVTPLIQRLLNDFTAQFIGDFDFIAWKQPRNRRLLDLMVASYHPAVRYVSIAGVNPYQWDMRIYHHTAASYLPRGFPPRFQWEETTYPPPDQPPGQLTKLLGELAEEVHLGPLQAMPELYPESIREPEGGDGAVPKWSAWFADEETDPAKGYIKNYKFPFGHSQLPHRAEVHAAIIRELRAALAGNA